MPKLTTFNLFKDFNEQPSFLSKPLNYHPRRSLANLRKGSFRIGVETMRYFRPKVPYGRTCVTCPNTNKEIECEVHYLFSCAAYHDLRQPWILNLQKPDNFEILSLEEKLKVALNEPMNVKHTAKFILDAFSARSKIIF